MNGKRSTICVMYASNGACAKGISMEAGSTTVYRQTGRQTPELAPASFRSESHPDPRLLPAAPPPLPTPDSTSTIATRFASAEPVIPA